MSAPAPLIFVASLLVSTGIYVAFGGQVMLMALPLMIGDRLRLAPSNSSARGGAATRGWLPSG